MTAQFIEVEPDAEALIKRMIALLIALEFGFETRYGAACPVCNGAKQEDWGYVERGPDRGHAIDCELRSVLDSLGVPGDPDPEGEDDDG